MSRRSRPAGRRPRPQRPTGAVTRIARGELRGGWPGPAGHRLRVARLGEAAAVAEVLRLAEVDLESGIVDTIGDDVLGRGVRLGIEFGHDAVLRHAAETIASTDGGPEAVLLGQATVLVAADPRGQITGALLMIPPGRILNEFLHHGLTPPQVLVAMLAVIKISALAVVPAARHQHLATALLARAVQLYTQLGYHRAYGSFHTRRHLDAFYQANGFTVLPRRRGFPLDVELGPPWGVQPGPGEQLFYRRLR